MANVLVPLTVKLDVPVEFVIDPDPDIARDPTVVATCRSTVALPIVKAPEVLPRAPAPVTFKVPAFTVVPPE